MKTHDWLQIVLYLGLLTVLVPVLGSYMFRVFSGNIPAFAKPLRFLETLTYKFCGVREKEEMNWKEYAWAVLLFNLFGFLVLFTLQMIQNSLPLNPQNFANVPWHLSFNTAASFITNTNWQSYGGESTMSYFIQMLGLAVQNFLSAATGIAVLLALFRGLTRHETAQLGNFWVDITRSTVYLLLPLSIILAVFLMSQGVIQNFSHYVTIKTLEGKEQILPMGPAASQIAIKQLGTNGGGFFNANSAHPFENPTPFSNFLEMFSILLIPAALCYTFGLWAKAKRQGWVLYIAMLLILVAGLGVALWAEYSVNPIFGLGGMMEGKEARLGVTNSILWATTTTAASNGSVNAMHSSLSPLAGGVALFNMMLGEIIFGGVGSGLYGMLLFVLLTVFIAGLMVGRTPEYLGKKIGTREIGLVIVTILLPSIAILIGAGAAYVLPAGLSSLLNKGPHGFTEILYAFTSASQNNGSAFAGLNANTPFYNVSQGFCMLIGRFAVIFPTLAVAGSLGLKKITPPSDGTFATDNSIFLILLVAVILIVGALTHLPALCLGPILEHLLMLGGKIF